MTGKGKRGGGKSSSTRLLSRRGKVGKPRRFEETRGREKEGRRQEISLKVKGIVNSSRRSVCLTLVSIGRCFRLWENPDSPNGSVTASTPYSGVVNTHELIVSWTTITLYHSVKSGTQEVERARRCWWSVVTVMSVVEHKQVQNTVSLVQYRGAEPRSRPSIRNHK
jgi:hypothetical protein